MEQKINESTAILWDVENIHPKQTGSIIEKIEDSSRIAYAIAFGDWNRKECKSLCEEFAKHNFEMIHTPHIEKLKNTADISLVTHGINILYHYPNIENFILLTGDADFRPLLSELRKAGKYIKIICDNQSASIDFVSMADESIDYRDLIEESIPNEKDESDDENDDIETFTKDKAFALLEETVGRLLEEQKTNNVLSGQVKVKMKLLDSSFDEKKLGYSSWQSFIKDAQNYSNIRFENGDNSKLKFEGSTSTKLPAVFVKLIEVLNTLKSDWDDDGYISFSSVAQKLNAKKYGYNRFKKLAIDAEKRGIVKVHASSSGRTWKIAIKS